MFTLDVDDGKCDEAPIVLRHISWSTITQSYFFIGSVSSSVQIEKLLDGRFVVSHFQFESSIRKNIVSTHLVDDEIALERLLRLLEQSTTAP